MKDRGRKERLSLNRAVRDILEEATGGRPAKKSARHHDFDKYVGRWRKAEADAFDEALKQQRRIDRDDWK